MTLSLENDRFIEIESPKLSETRSCDTCRTLAETSVSYGVYGVYGVYRVYGVHGVHGVPKQILDTCSCHHETGELK
jgi:hypothetical protein